MITGINGSRSAEWRSQMRLNAKGPEKPPAYMDPDRYRREGELKQIGNQKTFNLEEILAKNVLASEYLQSLQSKTFDELIDEIYLQVKDADPWLVRESGIGNREFNIAIHSFPMSVFRLCNFAFFLFFSYFEQKQLAFPKSLTRHRHR